jgi:hypothetical protein
MAKAQRKNLESIAKGGVNIFDNHHSFVNRNSCVEGSGPLEITQRLSYRYWPLCNGVCCGFSNCK